MPLLAFRERARLRARARFFLVEWWKYNRAATVRDCVTVPQTTTTLNSITVTHSLTVAARLYLCGQSAACSPPQFLLFILSATSPNNTPHPATFPFVVHPIKFVQDNLTYDVLPDAGLAMLDRDLHK